MATMSEDDRIAAWANFLRAISNDSEVDLSEILTETQAAINAADGWVSDNEASYNTALPTAFKAWATTKHKALLLMYVVTERYNLGI